MKAILVILLLFYVPRGSAGKYSNPHCYSGRSVIVQMFEWKWSEVAAECESFLAPKHFCGVQVSPPHENRMVFQPDRPWWERYQPVSYALNTRSGNEAQFMDMVDRCNRVHVRVFVDLIINHMADTRTHGRGTGNSFYHGEQRTYPTVPFSGWDFHEYPECPNHDLKIRNYSNATEVRMCQLNELADLNLNKSWVQEKVVEAMNHLIDIGVAGFYINYAKYMWPYQLDIIYSQLKSLHTTYFSSGTEPFIYHQFEEISGEAIGSSEYTPLGLMASYKFGPKISSVFRLHDQPRSLSYYMTSSWGLVNSANAIVFIDDQVTQRRVSQEVLSYRSMKEYGMAVAFMLAYPYGFPRIMSGYKWNRNIVNNSDTNAYLGPPSTNASSCTGNWVCEHHQFFARNMAEFRVTATGAGVNNWWHNTANQIAFSRGNKGFIAINADRNYDINHYIQTGMSSGIYCDIISGDHYGGGCTGTRVSVRVDGIAHIVISRYSSAPIIAIHQGSRISSIG